MKLTIQRKTLSEILSRCAGVTKTKSPNPIVANVLLRADASLHAAATDLFHSVSTSAPAEVAEPGVVAVNCRDLLERVKSLPEGLVTLATEASKETLKLKVTAGKRKHVLTTFDHGAFPAILTTLEAGRKAGPNVLSGLLAQVKHAAATEVERPQVNSVLLELTGETLSATATDGKRLAYATATIEPGEPLSGGQAIVPLAAVDALIGLLGGEATVFSWTDARLLVRSGETVFATQLVTGTYPPVAKQVQTISRNPMALDRREFMSAVASVQKASPMGEQYGMVELRVGPGIAKLLSEGNGEAEDEIDLDYTGKEYAIGLQGNYALEALGTLDAERVHVSVSDELDPVFFWVAGAPGFRLVMPRRLREAGVAK